MLKTEIKQLLESERQAVRAWWAGAHDTPLVLTRRDPDYCVCDTFLPSRFAYARLFARYSICAVAKATPPSALKNALYRLLGVRIGRGVYISPGATLDPLFPSLIELADDSLLGLGCCILTHEYTARNFRIGRVRVGRNSVVGAFATVRAGVTIGDNCTIGANSFVNRDVPDGATVGGVPARPLPAAERE